MGASAAKSASENAWGLEVQLWVPTMLLPPNCKSNLRTSTFKDAGPSDIVPMCGDHRQQWLDPSAAAAFGTGFGAVEY